MRVLEHIYTATRDFHEIISCSLHEFIIVWIFERFAFGNEIILSRIIFIGNYIIQARIPRRCTKRRNYEIANLTFQFV